MSKKILSEEHKKKIGESLKGRIAWNKGKSSWNKGKPMSASAKEKLRETLREQYLNGRKVWCKGLTKDDPRVRSLVEKSQKTIAERGSFSLEKNPRWKGGKYAYKNKALNHFGKTCHECGKTDERPKHIVVHHKDKNRENNELSNLEVLCSKCHRKKHPQKASEYQKRRAKECHTGKIVSEETRLKMSYARKLWWQRQ